MLSLQTASGFTSVALTTNLVCVFFILNSLLTFGYLGGSSLLADPIANLTGCQRDIQYFKQLGINTVRVYTVDNSANHDDCMNLLANAGIYLALDVNTPAFSLNRADEASISQSYNAVYLQFIFSTIDAFAKYANTSPMMLKL
jgi:1,3-beta-glucanosyltransferase GAS5